MIRLKRRNTAWLLAMALLIGFALLAAPVSAAVQLSLIGALAVAVIASMIELGPERASLLDALHKAPLQRRITPQAREASERAAARAGYFNRNGIVMLDIGLIAMQTGVEGLAMRRTRNISKDDDGVRPFITLYVFAGRGGAAGAGPLRNLQSSGRRAIRARNEDLFARGRV